MPVLLPLLLLACVHPAPPAPPGPDEDACAAMLDEALKGMDAEPAKADAAFADGYSKCGPGFGFLEARTFVSFAASRWDEGGEYLAKVMTEPDPSPLALKLVAGAMPKFSPATQARLRALGKTADAPVFVPDVGSEYAWVSMVSCGVAEKIPADQALIEGPKGSLDRLTFNCPGAVERQAIYFDFSADPMERAFKQELNGQKKAK